MGSGTLLYVALAVGLKEEDILKIGLPHFILFPVYLEPVGVNYCSSKLSSLSFCLSRPAGLRALVSVLRHRHLLAVPVVRSFHPCGFLPVLSNLNSSQWYWTTVFSSLFSFCIYYVFVFVRPSG